MADYAKKTVAELTEILKSRNLPSSGKKAELVARLNEHDKQTQAEEVAPVSEPEPAPSAEPAPPVTAATTAITSTAPTSEPSASVVQPPTDPTSTAGADHPSPDTALATQTTYSLNLPTSTLDTELAKRKARADRFGTGAATTADTTESSASNAVTDPTSQTDAQALKNLERAKRFGTGQTAIGKLDEALPSEIARASRKRGHAAVAEATELDDPGLKRSFVQRGRGRGGRGGVVAKHRGSGGGGGGRAPPPATGSKPQGVQKAPAFTSEKDRLAAEARKKKFATA